MTARSASPSTSCPLDRGVSRGSRLTSRGHPTSAPGGCRPGLTSRAPGGVREGPLHESLASGRTMPDPLLGHRAVEGEVAEVRMRIQAAQGKALLLMGGDAQGGHPGRLWADWPPPVPPTSPRLPCPLSRWQSVTRDCPGPSERTFLLV